MDFNTAKKEIQSATFDRDGNKAALLWQTLTAQDPAFTLPAGIQFDLCRVLIGARHFKEGIEACENLLTRFPGAPVALPAKMEYARLCVDYPDRIPRGVQYIREYVAEQPPGVQRDEAQGLLDHLQMALMGISNGGGAVAPGSTPSSGRVSPSGSMPPGGPGAFPGPASPAVGGFVPGRFVPPPALPPQPGASLPPGALPSPGGVAPAGYGGVTDPFSANHVGPVRQASGYPYGIPPPASGGVGGGGHPGENASDTGVSSESAVSLPSVPLTDSSFPNGQIPPSQAAPLPPAPMGVAGRRLDAMSGSAPAPPLSFQRPPGASAPSSPPPFNPAQYSPPSSPPPVPMAMPPMQGVPTAAQGMPGNEVPGGSLPYPVTPGGNAPKTPAADPTPLSQSALLPKVKPSWVRAGKPDPGTAPVGGGQGGAYLAPPVPPVPPALSPSAPAAPSVEFADSYLPPEVSLPSFETPPAAPVVPPPSSRPSPAPPSQPGPAPSGYSSAGAMPPQAPPHVPVPPPVGSGAGPQPLAPPPSSYPLDFAYGGPSGVSPFDRKLTEAPPSPYTDQFDALLDLGPDLGSLPAAQLPPPPPPEALVPPSGVGMGPAFAPTPPSRPAAGAKSPAAAPGASDDLQSPSLDGVSFDIEPPPTEELDDRTRTLEVQKFQKEQEERQNRQAYEALLQNSKFSALLPVGKRIHFEDTSQILAGFMDVDISSAKRKLRRGKGIVLRDLSYDDMVTFYHSLLDCPQKIVFVRQSEDLDFGSIQTIMSAQPGEKNARITTEKGIFRVDWEKVKLISAGWIQSSKTEEERLLAVDMIVETPRRHLRLYDHTFNYRSWFGGSPPPPEQRFRVLTTDWVKHCPGAEVSHTIRLVAKEESEDYQVFSSALEFDNYNRWLLLSHFGEQIDPARKRSKAATNFS